MGRNVEISLETFGNKRLTAVLTPEEVKGKSVEQLIANVTGRNWTGEDAMTLQAIRTQLEASGKYTATVGVGGVGAPVKFQPVRLGESAESYVQDLGLPEDQLRIAVTGDHTVGYR